MILGFVTSYWGAKVQCKGVPKSGRMCWHSFCILYRKKTSCWQKAIKQCQLKQYLCQYVALTVRHTRTQTTDTHTHWQIHMHISPLLPTTLLCSEKGGLLYQESSGSICLLETTGALPACSRSIMWNRQMDGKMGQWPAGGEWTCTLSSIGNCICFYATVIC